MNKALMIFATLTLFASQSNAQDADCEDCNKTDFRSDLMFGVKGGLNLSNVYDSKGDLFNADAKLGIAAGGFLSIPLGKFVGIQPELLLSQKGFRATGLLFNSQYSFTRTTTYLDIPVLFAFKPSEFITVLAGPQYSYLINQKDVFGSPFNTIEQITAFKNDNLRKNTVCLTFGADITLKRVVIGARAGWDVQNNNGNGISTIPRYKNAWYQLTAGFRF